MGWALSAVQLKRGGRVWIGLNLHMVAARIRDHELRLLIWCTSAVGHNGPDKAGARCGQPIGELMPFRRVYDGTEVAMALLIDGQQGVRGQVQCDLRAKDPDVDPVITTPPDMRVEHIDIKALRLREIANGDGQMQNRIFCQSGAP